MERGLLGDHGDAVVRKVVSTIIDTGNVINQNHNLMVNTVMEMTHRKVVRS